MATCQRCYKPTNVTIMSMYSEAMICLDCQDAETKRDDYAQAEAKDLREYAGRLEGQGMSHAATETRRQADKLEQK